MSDRKYASDYRMEEHITAAGTMESQRVYCGTWFAFLQEGAAVRRYAKKHLASCGICLVLLLPMLFNNTQLGRTYYILFPVAFSLIPLYQLTAIGLRVLKISGPMTRQQRDQTEGRLAAAALWFAFLTAVSVIGCLVLALNHGLTGGEVLTALAMAAASALSVQLFRQRGNLKTREIVPS